jgi:hypothetical protein
VLKDEVAMFEKFHMGTSLHSLNFGTIILLPKNNDTKKIRQYRPIYFLNASFNNYIPKLGTYKLMKVAQQIMKLT